MPPRPRIVISSAVFCLMTASAAFAASSPGINERWIADTSVSATLQTFSINVPSSATSNGNFEYELGFGSQEQPAIGALFDSLTIALSRADGSQSANIVTADVFGLTIMPITAGSLLGNGNVSVTQIPHDASALRESPTMFAYQISITLPPELVGQNLRTAFSLFNNGDAIASVGHASVVPEPRSMVLVLVGIAVIVLKFLRRAARS